jgi:hypothetical protein
MITRILIAAGLGAALVVSAANAATTSHPGKGRHEHRIEHRHQRTECIDGDTMSYSGSNVLCHSTAASLHTH